MNITKNVTLREPVSSDLEHIVERHGQIYFDEYGWNQDFEALVERICSDFSMHHDLNKERCWIAELDGRFAGSIFLIRSTDQIAKLRLLLVEPEARGYGIGKRLVDECIRFARQAGYLKITLWTNSILDAARHLYEQAGFTLVNEEPHHSFGHDLVSQTWELML